MSGSFDRHVGVVVVATVLMVIAACLTERVQGRFSVLQPYILNNVCLLARSEPVWPSGKALGW